jgi:hypothetical protein
LIETENQRRWWFATHPEFSHEGERTRKPQKESSGISPEDVDRYVEEALKHQRDPVIIAILEATKRWFGTEGQTPESYAELGLPWDTEAGGKISRRSGSRGSSLRRALEIMQRPPMTLRQRQQADIIERELEKAGANPRDYRLTTYSGMHVAERDSLFERDQKDPQGRTNAQRMQGGLAPLDREGEPLNLHHANQSKEGPLLEVTREEHQSFQNRKRPSEIERRDFNNFKRNYWRARAESIRMPDPPAEHLRERPYTPEED